MTTSILRDTNYSFVETSTKENGESFSRKLEKGSTEYGNACMIFHQKGVAIEIGNSVFAIDENGKEHQMKAYEVKINITGGSKDQAKNLFVEAQSKSQLENIEEVVKVWERKNMSVEACPYYIEDDFIAQKENYTSPY